MAKFRRKAVQRFSKPPAAKPGKAKLTRWSAGAKSVRGIIKNSSGTAASKRERVLALLRQSGGTTIGAISAATNWQSHSVRGFLARVVKKQLKLALVSEKIGAERIYRIIKPGGAT